MLKLKLFSGLKFIGFTLMLALGSTGVTAQQLDARTASIIKVKFINANKFFEAKNYDKALKKIVEVEKLLAGKSSATALNLKIKIMVAKSEFIAADQALNVLYGLNPSNEILNDISQYSIVLESNLKQQKARERVRLQKEHKRAAAEESKIRLENIERKIRRDWYTKNHGDSSQVVMYKHGKLWGFINKAGDIVQAFVYKNIEPFGSKILVATKPITVEGYSLTQCYLLSREGEVLVRGLGGGYECSEKYGYITVPREARVNKRSYQRYNTWVYDANMQEISRHGILISHEWLSTEHHRKWARCFRHISTSNEFCVATLKNGERWNISSSEDHFPMQDYLLIAKLAGTNDNRPPKNGVLLLNKSGNQVGRSYKRMKIIEGKAYVSKKSRGDNFSEFNLSQHLKK
jgi:hypothetical protein